MNRLALAAVAALLLAGPAQSDALPWPLFSPRVLSICAYGTGCATNLGVDARLTRRVLGPEVAAQVHDGRKVFGLPGGIRCSTLTVACWGGNDKTRRAVERALFGR